MRSNSNSIGDGGSINSNSIVGEGDGKREKVDPNRGAGSIIGPYSHVPVSQKDPRVNSKEPPREASWSKVSQPK